jgi:hypothetical protein
LAFSYTLPVSIHTPTAAVWPGTFCDATRMPLLVVVILVSGTLVRYYEMPGERRNSIRERRGNKKKLPEGTSRRTAAAEIGQRDELLASSSSGQEKETR